MPPSSPQRRTDGIRQRVSTKQPPSAVSKKTIFPASAVEKKPGVEKIISHEPVIDKKPPGVFSGKFFPSERMRPANTVPSAPPPSVPINPKKEDVPPRPAQSNSLVIGKDAVMTFPEPPVKHASPSKAGIALGKTQDDVPPAKPAVHTGRMRAMMSHPIVIRMAVGVGIAAIGLGLMSTVFARATITVKPKQSPLEIKGMAVTFDASAADLRAAEKIVPTEFFEFQGEAKEEFEATGETNEDTSARGMVRIYNNFGLSPQGLIARTRFMTEDKKLYRLPRGITVPPAKKENGSLIPQFVEAELVADKSGDAYNVSGEVMLNIPGLQGSPKYEGFYAKTISGFSGGGKGSGRVVTRQDLAAAQEKITKQAYDQLKLGVAKKIPPHFTVADGLREIRITDIILPPENTRAQRFVAEAKAVARVFVFRESDIYALLRETYLKQDPYRRIIESSADLHYQITESDTEGTAATVMITGTAMTSKTLPDAELRGLAKTRNEDELRTLLRERGDYESFGLKIFPPWVFRIPGKESKIHIITIGP